MCTVTYYPTSDGFVLTSTRDEVSHRETSSPAFYKVGDQEILFPKDIKSGGTWIATDGHILSLCLLNGAWSNHTKSEFYRKSRGKILLEAFESNSFETYVTNADLNEVEPFTLLAIEEKTDRKVMEFRWDGEEKHFKNLNIDKPFIKASFTLYPPYMQAKKERLFENWIARNIQNPPAELLAFHILTDPENSDNSILLHSKTGPKSVSITQFHRTCNELNVSYYDLLANSSNHTSFKDPICL